MIPVVFVMGTRPEAIKMAPIVVEARSGTTLKPVVVATGQHREMLDQVTQAFGIQPDADLDVFVAGQTVTDITSKVLQAATDLLRESPPRLVVVQGDTTSAFAFALAAFYQHIPVCHVEAGLRTADPRTPFPEEMNRRLLTRVADLHAAPTDSARLALLAEGIKPEQIVVTGNSVIDALLATAASMPPVPARGARRLVLVTAHRRESWGEPLRRVAQALAEVATEVPDVDVVLPLHRNPVVRSSIEPVLGGLSNVSLVEPVEYADFVDLMRRCDIVVTDSGGVQEEAPALGKPVLVIRDTTERVEGVEHGTARLVGTRTQQVARELRRLLEDPGAYDEMAQAVNPYGDGLAGRRTVAAIEEFLGVGSRLPDFRPVPGTTPLTPGWAAPASS
jgi:UDP-N-acetylglucosamine 2-epimerase (non-hydrolysing)